MEQNINYVSIKDIMKYLALNWYVYIVVVLVAIVGCFFYEQSVSGKEVSIENQISLERIEKANGYIENSFLQKIQPEEVHVKTLNYSIVVEDANKTNFTAANALMYELGAYSQGREIFDIIEDEMQVSNVYLEEVIEVSIESNCMSVKIMGDSTETVETIAEILKRELNHYYTLVKNDWTGLQLVQNYENYSIVVDEQLGMVQENKVNMFEKIIQLEERENYGDQSSSMVYIFVVIGAVCLVTAILLLVYMFMEKKEVNE